MIGQAWDAEQALLSKSAMISPHTVEFMCLLERTLNVAYTGNVVVITAYLMNPLLDISVPAL